MTEDGQCVTNECQEFDIRGYCQKCNKKQLASLTTLYPQYHECVESCGTDYTLTNGICVSALPKGYRGSVGALIACNTSILHPADFDCERCTATDKCTKCMAGKTCTLDCSDYPYALPFGSAFVSTELG